MLVDRFLETVYFFPSSPIGEHDQHGEDNPDPEEVLAVAGNEASDPSESQNRSIPHIDPVLQAVAASSDLRTLTSIVKTPGHYTTAELKPS